MPFVETDGNRLYYEDSGGDGPAIIFCHGGFFDHTMWEHQVAALSGQFRCITWDSRGHGMSECNDRFDYWDAARDAFAILDELGIGQAVVVGMSQGGWLAQRAALEAPERCRGIVLVDTSVKLLSDEEVAGYGQLSQGWQAMGPVGDIANAIMGVQFGGSDYDGSRYVGRWQSKPPGDWAHVWDSLLHGRDDITGRLKDISCPVLFIHGTVDQAFPVAFAEEAAGMVADSRGVVVVEGAPHCSPLTHPDEVNDALRRFLADV